MALDKPTIGIRQADGSFYDIMEESRAGHKRLVLSAARTDQRGVKIELFRSTDGTLVGAESLGSIKLDDPEGLGFKDIEFHMDLHDTGVLDAAANLPGQLPRRLSVDLSEFQPTRTDRDILGDTSFDNADLDTLDDTFTETEPPALEPELLTMDLPELDEMPPARSDAEILGDETLDAADVDVLDDFAEPDVEPLEAFQESSPEGVVPSAPSTFDLGDLDAGFGDEPEPELVTEPDEAAPAAEDEWESINLDGLEPMEFLDTGDEISAPSEKNTPAPSPLESVEDFSLDDEAPLELGDLNSDLSDLPDLEELGENSATQLAEQNDLDQDFLAPPALTELPGWEPSSGSKDQGKSKVKAPKKEKHHPGDRAASRHGDEGASESGLDKTALFLSLSALVLLVILILVLIVLNVFRSPVAPVIQPEVLRWKPLAETALPGHPGPKVIVADLGSSSPPTFEAASVLDVPQELKGAEVCLRLGPGETSDDATRRFGPPSKVQGNLLFW